MIIDIDMYYYVLESISFYIYCFYCYNYYSQQYFIFRIIEHEIIY